MKAVSRLYACDPYATGKEFTLADLYTNYVFGLAGMLAKKVVDVDLLADQPQISELIKRLADRPSIAKVTADMARK